MILILISGKSYNYILEILGDIANVVTYKAKISRRSSFTERYRSEGAGCCGLIKYVALDPY